MKVKYNKKSIEKTFVLQQEQSDCGVASLLSLIQYYGGSGSLENLRELSGTNKQGTTLLGLFQCANKLGFKAEGKEADIPSLIHHDSPVILHVIIDERLQHYFVCYGFENGKFLIGDPGKGIEYYKIDDLERVWKTKTCLVLEPNEHFIKSKAERINKKNWFINLLKKDYRLLSFSIILGLGIALLGMSMALFSQKLIDDILPSKNLDKLITGVALVAILLLIRIFFIAIRDYFLIQQTKNFNNRIIDSFYSSLLKLPKLFFDSRNIGELVARLNDTQRVQRVIGMLASKAIIDVLITIVSVLFLCYYSWQCGLITFICLPIYFILLKNFNKHIILAQKEVMQGYAFSESNFIMSMQGIATIKNDNRQTFFKKRNQFIYGSYQEKVFNLGRLNIRISSISGIFSVLFLITILTYTSIQVYLQSMQIGEMIAILGIAGSLLPSVATLALITIPINEASVAFNRMYEFTSFNKEKEEGVNIKNFESLRIKNLSFRFAGRRQLLKHIDLQIAKNECIAIVGESGCGKSTLGQIIQKFYNFENGEIIINDFYKLEDLKTEDWRNIIGVVPQDVTIFPGNVIENISLGKKDDPNEIIKYCENNGFKKFISDLPQGYATMLGEEGINLSGGQKQLLAIIRVLYRKPQLLVLDEFTSAMDRVTEKFVLNLLMDLKQNISIIFISHRLHSIKKIADRIYIIENGVSDNYGTHNQLLETENFYSEFWNNI